MPPVKKTRKIAILGPSLVGKSALSYQFVEETFLEGYVPTVESTTGKNITINSQEYELILIDTAGLDRCATFPAQYLIDAHGCILVYDIKNRQSFEVVSSLRDKLLNATGNPNIPLVLVGNKLDLSECRQVSEEEGKKLAEKWKVKFLETSAKSNADVRKIFETLMSDIERVDKGGSEGCVIW